MPRIFGFVDLSGTLRLPPRQEGGGPGQVRPANGQYGPDKTNRGTSAHLFGVTQTNAFSVVTGTLNIRRGRQKNLYNRELIGQAFRFETGEAPNETLTGSWGSIPDPIVYAHEIATPPSWTQYHIGKKHAFVAMALSSSHVEVSRLNTFLSGNLPLETGPVPASASAYYSKQSQLVYKVYKLSASIDLPVDPVTLERYPSQQENPAVRGIFDPVSGSYRNNSYWNPAIFTIEIPDYGKIRDIRVWVEFVHDVRGGNGTGSLTSSFGNSPPYYRGGLGGVQVALRSPNVTFPYAHPLWNAPTTANFQKRPLELQNGTDGTHPQWYTTGSGGVFGDKYQRVPELLKNSYLLWAGHSVEDDLAMSLSNQAGGTGGSQPLSPPQSTDLVPYGDVNSGTLYLLNLPGGGYPNGFNPYYAEWDSDIDMRTVFWDGSPIPNPRDLSCLFTASTPSSPGGGASLYAPPTFSGSTFPYSGSAASRPLWYNSPNSQAVALATAALGPIGLGSTYSDYNPTPGGFGFPWFYDGRIPLGSLTSGRGTNSWLSGPPPSGWLTSGNLQPGPGEFPTSTGSNLGPANIRGVYPILDDVYVQKLYDEPYGGIKSITLGGFSQVAQPIFPTLPSQHAKIVGFRPGLRGTEIHGKWQLMIGTSADFDPNLGMVANQRAGVWFRQFRLEFILDVGQPPASFIHSRTRKYKKPSYVPQKDGNRRVQIMSGSAQWDIGINYVSVQQDPDYGRTIGITDNTGSSPDFAVFTRLTGALADMLFASASLTGTGGTAHAIYSYLNNPTGTPYIPISSGSSVAPAFQFFNTSDLPTKSIISQIIRPRPSIPQQHSLAATTTRLGGYTRRSDATAFKILQLQKQALE
ncbi:MAG: hypothetical protein JO270_20860 [Acidobacteriaceae bacterium]|nr:hypothetical protein [Acidobacteriaceae bacterium]